MDQRKEDIVRLFVGYCEEKLRDRGGLEDSSESVVESLWRYFQIDLNFYERGGADWRVAKSISFDDVLDYIDEVAPIRSR